MILQLIIHTKKTAEESMQKNCVGPISIYLLLHLREDSHNLVLSYADVEF